MTNPPSKPGRYEHRPEGALLHVPAGSSYMTDTAEEPSVRNGRVMVRGRCLDARGGFGVVARMRTDGAWTSGYALIVCPETSSYALSDFRVSLQGAHSRDILDWQVSDRIRGVRESNLVELRLGGSTLQIFLNGFLVDEVVDNSHERGVSGWVVRAYEGVGDVLLEQIEVSEAASNVPERSVPVSQVISIDASPDHTRPESMAPEAAALEQKLLPRLTSELDALPERLVSPTFWIGRLKDPSFNPLAGMPNCAPDTLTALAHSPRVALRVVVAAHQRCPDETLARLAADVAVPVRVTVACRPYSPGIVLDRLASDEHPMVREAVASHPLVTTAILERLAMDEEASVRAAVASHPGCPPELRARLGAPTESPPGGRPRAERVWFPGHVEPRGPKPRSPS